MSDDRGGGGGGGYRFFRTRASRSRASHSHRLLCGSALYSRRAKAYIRPTESTRLFPINDYGGPHPSPLAAPARRPRHGAPYRQLARSRGRPCQTRVRQFIYALFTRINKPSTNVELIIFRSPFDAQRRGRWRGTHLGRGGANFARRAS